MQERSYDIVIVGAGPAGSTFARQIASLGRSVLLIDGEDASHSKPCGGLLAPDAQRFFAEYDISLPKEILVDPQIFAVDTVDLTRGLSARYQRHYLNMDRYRFDRFLLDLIPDTISLEKARVTAVTTSETGAYILTLNKPDHEPEYVRATYLIGADGANSIVRKSCFRGCSEEEIRKGRDVKRYLSIQQWFHAEGIDPGYYCVFDEETSDSCSWFLKKDRYVIFGGAYGLRNAKDAFARQKQKFEACANITLGDPVKTEACLVCSPRHFRDFRMAERNAFLIGEAAGFISASSFEGISSAMRSGCLLADAFRCGGSADGSRADIIADLYRKRCRKLRMKLYLKSRKRFVLCSPFLRSLIMKSGIGAIRKSKYARPIEIR